MRSWRLALGWLVVILTGWRSVNYVSAGPVGWWDSGIFTSAGYFVTEGLVPYRDFFDHKPPVIYYLNALALTLSGGETVGVRWLERSFALLGGACLFALLRRITPGLLAPLVGTLSYYFLLYHPDLLWGGNLTSEYGAALTVAGALCWHRSGGPTRCAALFAWLGGIVLGLACLTKEPFVMTGIALSPLLLRQAGRTAPVLSRRVAYGVAGVLTPLAVLVAYFAVVGALGSWWDVLGYNVAYLDQIGGGRIPLWRRCLWGARTLVGLLGKTSTALPWLLAGGGIAGIVVLIRQRSVERATWALSCLAALVAVSFSTRGFNHYYLQAVPVLAVTAAIAVATVAALPRGTWINLAVLALVVLVDHAAIGAWLGRLAVSFERPTPLPVSAAVAHLSDPRDTIWCPSTTGPYTQVYAEARRLPATRWFYAFNHTFLARDGRSQREQMAALLAELRRNPPRLIVVGNPRLELGVLNMAGIPGWIESEYEQVSGEAGPLWRRR